MPNESSSSGSSESSLCSLPMYSSGSGGGGTRPGTGGGHHAPHANKALLESLTQSEQINLQAGEPEHAALAARDITPQRMADQADNITQARARSGEAISGTVDKEESTELEGEARRLLLESVAEICTAAQQKFARHNRTHLENYRIGEKWDALGRPLLEQYSLDISNCAAADNLPGITPAKIVLARQRRTDYVASKVTQTDAQGNATGQRISFQALLKLILDFRYETQYAAQAEWPHTNPANAAVRVKFGLPPKRKFKA